MDVTTQFTQSGHTHATVTARLRGNRPPPPACHSPAHLPQAQTPPVRTSCTTRTEPKNIQTMQQHPSRNHRTHGTRRQCHHKDLHVSAQLRFDSCPRSNPYLVVPAIASSQKSRTLEEGQLRALQPGRTHRGRQTRKTARASTFTRQTH